MIKGITDIDIKRIPTGQRIGEIKYVSRLDYAYHRSPCTLLTTGRLHRFRGHKNLRRLYDQSNRAHVSQGAMISTKITCLYDVDLVFKPDASFGRVYLHVGFLLSSFGSPFDIVFQRSRSS